MLLLFFKPDDAQAQHGGGGGGPVTRVKSKPHKRGEVEGIRQAIEAAFFGDADIPAVDIVTNASAPKARTNTRQEDDEETILMLIW